jgi:outer membrane protein assembly factor BamB
VKARTSSNADMSVRMLSATGFLILIMASIGAEPRAQAPASWPGLWGPARSGWSGGPSTPIQGLRELWRRPTAGGYSEVAVSGNQAVTLELRGAEDFVVALDAATGKERWATRIGPIYRGHGGSDDGPISTPAIDGGDVFALGPHGDFVAIDAATGRERWRHQLNRDFNAQPPIWAFAASPLVVDRLVIVPAAGANARGLLAFDRATGKPVWNNPHSKTPGYSSAVLTDIAGTRQIIISSADFAYGVSPSDGRLLWSAPGPGPGEVSNSAIILPGDRVLLTYWERAVMLKIEKRPEGLAAAELWRATTLRGANGPTLYREGALYGFAGGFMVCLDANSGKERWRVRSGDGTMVGVGSQLLFLSSSTGNLHVIDASPERYAERTMVQAFKPDVRSVTGPSVTAGRVYVRNLREIAAFEIVTSRGPATEPR